MFNDELSPEDKMVCELIEVMQPDTTINIYDHLIYINGEPL